MTVQRLSLSIGCVMNTRSPHTIGVEFPRSGSGVFHRTFSVALQCSGRLVSVVTPVPSGPRQLGQLPANADTQAASTKNMAMLNAETDREEKRMFMAAEILC